MAIAAPPRRLVDLAFVCVIAACAVLYARQGRVPELPAGICAETDGVPRLPARASVAAVFARIEGPQDVTSWSMETLASELRAQGFRDHDGVFERADAIVELIGPLADDEAVVEAALNRELATRDVVYYNGHHFRGRLELRARNHPIAFLDTCNATQFYASLADSTDLVANRSLSITGSVYGFADLLAALLSRREQTWRSLLAPVNAAAIERTAHRDVYPEPERYGRVGYCGQGPAAPP